MQVDLVIRFDYGSAMPWVRKLADGSGIRATVGADTLFLHTPVPLSGKNFRTNGRFSVREKEKVAFVLSHGETYGTAPARIDAQQALDETTRFWRDWCGQCTYEGDWREAVMRSLITLKALIYSPTGGIVAAPTTSLPEKIGGAKNWDYRYCWLRDATFTLLALQSGGYNEEARAWRDWLCNSVAGTPQEIQIMYGLSGNRRLTEIELPWLEGYEKSAPVRIGNQAHRQLQLDVYGEVLDAMYQSYRSGLQPNAEAWRIQRGMANHIADHWRQPDQGIWEMRGEPQHFTHSKVMAWVAMDRAVRSATETGQDGDIDRWKQVREEIHREVCALAFDTQLNAFVQHYGSDKADASTLVIPLVGFLPASDPRVKGTLDFVEERLADDGLIRRHAPNKAGQGLPADEGTFLLCSFWFVDCLTMIGEHDKAKALFERLLTVRNDVGLLAEEYDPKSARQLGNFPQAFSHIGLINAAAHLSRCQRSVASRSV